MTAANVESPAIKCVCWTEDILINACVCAPIHSVDSVYLLDWKASTSKLCAKLTHIILVCESVQGPTQPYRCYSPQLSKKWKLNDIIHHPKHPLKVKAHVHEQRLKAKQSGEQMLARHSTTRDDSRRVITRSLMLNSQLLTGKQHMNASIVCKR